MTDKALPADELRALLALWRDPEYVETVAAGALAAGEEELAHMQALQQQSDRAGLLAYARQLTAEGQSNMKGQSNMDKKLNRKYVDVFEVGYGLRQAHDRLKEFARWFDKAVDCGRLHADAHRTALQSVLSQLADMQKDVEAVMDDMNLGEETEDDR